MLKKLAPSVNLYRSFTAYIRALEHTTAFARIQPSRFFLSPSHDRCFVPRAELGFLKSYGSLLQRLRSTHSNDLAPFQLQAPCQFACHLINCLFIAKLEVIYISCGGWYLREITDLFSNLHL
jgi:hypothetical protein